MEHVFVVDRARFFAGSWPQGFVPLAGDAAQQLLAALREAGRFEPRPVAEETPAWKQLVPYCVIRRPGEVFCVQRKKAQTESRLHGLLSIGLGGHLNPPAAAAAPPAAGAEGLFLTGLATELGEELEGLPWPGEAGIAPVFCGLLNDDANAVGRVHAGLVYTLDLPPPSRSLAPPSRSLPRPHRSERPAAPGTDLRVREISKMAGGFRSLVELEALWQDPSRFESWSLHLLHTGIAGRMAVSHLGRPRPDPNAANWQHEERPYG